MKKYYNLFLFAFFAIFITSCQEDIEGMGEEKDKTKLVFINACVNNANVPAKASREVAIMPVYNGIVYNNFPLAFPWTNGYKAFVPPTLNMQLDTCFSPGNNPPGVRGKVKDLSLTLSADNYYQLFAVGTIYNVDTFLVKDNLSFPTPGKAKILFLNLSMDAGAIDIVNNVTNEVIAANITYKQRTAYKEVDPGVYKVRINAAGTSTVLRASRDLIIDANSVYTVWARGLKTPPAGALSNHPLQLSYHANRWTY